MSEYYFASVRGLMVPSEVIANRRHAIARAVGGEGCGYVLATLPGEGRRAWGYCPNMGHPFDRAVASAIERAWMVEGVGDVAVLAAVKREAEVEAKRSKGTQRVQWQRRSELATELSRDLER
jgi:hypothetical protein